MSSVDGAVTGTATPHPDAAWITLAIRSGAPIAPVSVDGEATGLKPAAGRWSRIRWSAATPLVVRSRSASRARVEVFAEERFDRWSAARPLPPRPATVQMWDIAGSTLVIGRVAVTAPPG